MKGLEISCAIVLRDQLAERLEAHAERLGKSTVALLADLIETILNDNLVDAVIDQ